MIDKKAQELVDKLEQYRKTLVKNEKASRDFLLKAGIIANNGNLTPRYRHLCIPLEQA
jgi:hypothetical protein